MLDVVYGAGIFEGMGQEVFAFGDGFPNHGEEKSSVESTKPLEVRPSPYSNAKIPEDSIRPRPPNRPLRNSDDA